ncbi:MAG TPA: pitrilysin family protein, partial [Bacteroidales bacterium]|nr:pitrilysin family protein [Bacteroidales bacterium]
MIRLINLLWLLPLFTLIRPAIGQEKMPIDPNIKMGKLDNGLVYYIRKNAKPEKRVELRLAVNAGSILETDDQQGLAHFCEHMCFNGTKNFPHAELVNTIERMGIKFGADLNAYTSFDETVYMLKVPTDQTDLIDKGFQILEDWAHQVTLDGKEIDKERGVILEEWRLGLGADDRMRKKSFPVIFKDSKYAERIPIGKPEILKTFKHETLRQFYKDWYRPNLQAVIVVGDIDVDQMEQKIKQHFSGIQNPVNERKREIFDLPDNKEPLVSIETDEEATSNTVMFFYKHPKKYIETIEDFKFQLMQDLFTGMINNRLEEIGQKPDCPYIYAGTQYGEFLARTKDSYLGYAVSKENQIEKSLETVMTENQRVKQFGFTATEFERQKTELLKRYEKQAKEFDKMESGNLAMEYVYHFLAKNPIPGAVKEFEFAKQFLPEIKLEEVNALSKQWITDNNLVVMITAPKKDGIKVPTKDDVLKIIDKVKSLQLTAYEDKQT